MNSKPNTNKSAWRTLEGKTATRGVGLQDALHIRHLADCRETIPQIARWLFAEWGQFVPGASVERGILRLQERLARGRVPQTLVAMEGRAAVGTVSLVTCDMDTHPHLSPWLASLYVAPEQRRRGIGSALVAAAVGQARRLGVDTLYLFTHTSEGLYTKLGWQRLESCLYREKEVVIMSKPLVRLQQGADGSQPLSLGSNSTSAAAGSRRSG